MKSQSELAQKRNDPGREMRNLKDSIHPFWCFSRTRRWVAPNRTGVASTGGKAAREQNHAWRKPESGKHCGKTFDQDSLRVCWSGRVWDAARSGITLGEVKVK